MAANKAPQQPSVPRPSATVVIVNRLNEVLLVQRNPQAKSFAGAHVFPGGNQDKRDASLAITAIRETFEESGLLLASPPPYGRIPDDATLEEARAAVHAEKITFQAFLEKHNLSADVDSLLPFTQWITPPTVPRRFHTQFYVSFLKDAPANFSSGNKQQHIPTPDGGQEVIAASFVRPDTAIESFRDRKINLMPPQFYILKTLSDILRSPTNTEHERGQVKKLADGAFGKIVINPVALPDKDIEGRLILTYEGDEKRGGPKGRLHRALVRFGAGGASNEIVLQRNWDIFNEVQLSAGTPGTKL